jgi:thiamine-phosphate pyrophosphorylase
MADNVAALVRLMLVTDDRVIEGRDLIALARAAERGGATSVQLRLKEADARELAGMVRRLVAALTVPVLVNDRPDVAIAAGAAGTHLGPDDVPVELVRRIAPPGFVIGASVGSQSEAVRAGAASYWGVGPWRDTSTKNAGIALGSDGFAALVRLAGGKPCIAIGGVRPDDLPHIRGAGGVGAAVVSGILGARDTESAARAYVEAWSASAPPPSRPAV